MKEKLSASTCTHGCVGCTSEFSRSTQANTNGIFGPSVNGKLLSEIFRVSAYHQGKKLI